MNTPLKFRNTFTATVTHKDGTEEKYIFPNGMTDVGRQYALDVALDSGTQLPSWYLGIIDAAAYSAVAASDTRASHAGWTELVAYTEGNLPEWIKSRTGNIMSNPAPAVFNFTTTETLKGLLVGESNTKGGTTGILWATALFPADVNVSNGSTLNVTYSVETV